MPILRLAIFIFLTLMLASLTAVASGPVTVDKNKEQQALAVSHSEPKATAGAVLKPAEYVVASRGADGSKTRKTGQTVPPAGENIPGAGQ
jgi:hypothetical protein